MDRAEDYGLIYNRIFAIGYDTEKAIHTPRNPTRMIIPIEKLRAIYRDFVKTGESYEKISLRHGVSKETVRTATSRGLKGEL